MTSTRLLAGLLLLVSLSFPLASADPICQGVPTTTMGACLTQTPTGATVIFNAGPAGAGSGGVFALHETDETGSTGTILSAGMSSTNLQGGIAIVCIHDDVGCDYQRTLAYVRPAGVLVFLIDHKQDDGANRLCIASAGICQELLVV